jgi:hypothetical protein
MIEPLRIAFEVACPVDHAFETWTSRASLWWPVTHTAEQTPGYEIRFEPRIGGRIYERTPSGRETVWGEVTAWEPPHRVCYLFHIMTVRERATDVDVRFSQLSPGSTRVEIIHSGWERLGAEAQSWRDLNNAGWDTLLPHYVAACARSA